MITKRSIIAEIILVISLLGACVYGFLWMKRQAKPVNSSALFCVVPPDALVVQRFKSFDDLYETYSSDKAFLGRFCAEENGLSRFLPFLSGNSLTDALFSVHHTGKNNVHVLLGLNFKIFSDGENLFERLCTEMGGATLYKRFNKVDIYRLFKEPSLLYIAVADGFLLAGTTPVVVESSIRHLMSGRSLMDNQAFESLVVLSSSSSEGSVYVNVRQFDKLFGALLGKRMQQYADFFSKCASWIALDGATSGEFLHFSGRLLTDKGDADFFATLKNQVPAPIKIWESVPSSTMALITFSLSDFERYRNQYGNYLEIHKRDKRAESQVAAWESKTQKKLNEWFMMLYPAEAALAWIDVKGEYQWVTIVRSSQIQQARKSLSFPVADPKQPPLILPNPSAGAFSAFFGPFFAKSTESHVTIMENTLFFGSQESLETLVTGYGKTLSLYSLMRQGRIRGKWMDESGISCVLQGAQARDSLIKMCDPRYTSLIETALDPFDYSLALIQVTSLGGNPYVNFLLSADNYKQGSTPAKSVAKEAVDNEPLPMNVATFKIFNHASRKSETITQTPEGALVLKDAVGRQTWRTSKKFSLVDQIVQIDFYKNDKLQMLYVSDGKELCLLDILGRMVPGFPKTLPTRVRKGPFLFDRLAQKEYEVFMIHTDNALRLYDKTGKEVADFKPFIPEDRIEQRPVLLTHAQATHYWLLYGAEKDYLLRSDGSIAVVLQRRNRIKQDAEVTIDENGVLHGFTTEGRILSVQLSSGTIKTRKP